MTKTKLTEEMAERAIRLKADGLSNGNIICLVVGSAAYLRFPHLRLRRPPLFRLGLLGPLDLAIPLTLRVDLL